MANTLLLDIALFLVSKSLATGDGVDIFRDFTPNEPDSLVTLHEYKGDVISQYSEVAHRSIQVIVRDRDADIARDKSVQIFKALRAGEDCRVDFTQERWGQVYLRQTPFFLKRDENDRIYYAFNIGITTTIE